MLKKRLLVLLFAVMILPVFADATWQEIQSKNKELYIDTSSITNQGALYLYWVKSDTQNGYKKMLMKSDCANNLTGVQKIIVYDKNGKKIKSEDVNQELNYVVPDSDAQTVYNYVYDMYKKTQDEENRKKNAITPNKFFNAINSINNAGYEVRSIKSNALDVIRGF